MQPRGPRKRDLIANVFNRSNKSSSGGAQAAQAAKASRAPTPYASTPSPLGTPPPSSIGERFLQAALNGLSKEDQETIQEHVTSKIQDTSTAVDKAYSAALEKKDVCEQKRWKWTFAGKEVLLRDEAEKVVRWLERFKSIGDVVANVDPIHVGLPWAGIRVILEMAVSESRQMAALVTGMDLALYMANRLRAYFEYFRHLPATQATDHFEKALIKMYTHVLEFFAIAIQTYKRSVPTRLVRALWETTSLQSFEDKSDKLGSRAEVEAAICERELSAYDRQTAERWMSDLNQTLEQLRDIRIVGQAVEALHVKLDLSKLKTAKGAMYNSFDNEHNTQCLEGTRTNVLHQINAWAGDLDSKRIFWLCGMAGTGKSTISRTIASQFDQQGCLGASFFFKRGEGDRGTAKYFFPTIVEQIVNKYPDLARSVADALDADTSLCERNLQEQFEKLLLQSLGSVTRHSLPPRRVIIVIDALDECERLGDVKTILRLLS